MFALCFVKDPGKQGIHEKAAAKYIESLNGITKFKTLPKDAEDSKYVIRGEVRNRREINGVGIETKSIDFEWEYRSYMVYASHKYTNEAGGAQDNQFNGIKNFVENAKYRNKQNVVFMALMDGDFYQIPYNHYKTKIEYINSEIPKVSNLIACTSEEIIEKLNKYITDNV